MHCKSMSIFIRLRYRDGRPLAFSTDGYKTKNKKLRIFFTLPLLYSVPHIKC